MAISTIGGAAASGGLTAPAGTKAQIAGYSSTGSYTATVPGGDYFFFAPGGSKLSCNGTTYSGSVDSLPLGGSNGTIQATPSPNFVRIVGQQAVTITVGPPPVTSRLGNRWSNGASSYNRNAIRFLGSTYAFPDKSTNNVVWTSSDGITWNSSSTTFAIGNCFMQANAFFFAGDTGSTNSLYTSTNGTTWTQRIMPTTTIADGRLAAVVYTNSKYVAFFRRATGGSVHTFTSTDGVTWTYGQSIGSIFSATANDGVYVATNGSVTITTGDSTVNNGYYSYATDGVSYTLGTAAGTNNFWTNIEVLNGTFVVFQRTGTSTYANIFSIAPGTPGTAGNTGSFPSGGFGSGAYGTGMFYDGTNYVVTCNLNNNNNSYTLAYSSYLGGWIGTAPLGNSNGTVGYNLGIAGSMYVNSRAFYTAADFRFGSTETFTFLNTATMPNIQGPGSFGLYRAHDTTTLN